MCLRITFIDSISYIFVVTAIDYIGKNSSHVISFSSQAYEYVPVIQV